MKNLCNTNMALWLDLHVVHTSILKSAHLSVGCDQNQEERQFLRVLISVCLLCLKPLDKEEKEMTARNNKNSIKKTRNKRSCLLFSLKTHLSRTTDVSPGARICSLQTLNTIQQSWWQGGMAFSQKTTHIIIHTLQWDIPHICSCPTSTPLRRSLGSLLVLSNTVSPGKDLNYQSTSCQPSWPSGPRMNPAADIRQQSCAAVKVDLVVSEQKKGDNKQVWK